MRILILSDRIPPESLGGAERIAWQTAIGLRDFGHDVSIITTSTQKQPIQNRDDIAVYTMQSDYPERWRSWLSIYNPTVIRQLPQLIAEIGPDIVHAHNVHQYLSYWSLKVVWQQNVPLVLTAHDAMSISYDKLTHFVASSQTLPIEPNAYRLPQFDNLQIARWRYNPIRNRANRTILRQTVNQHIAVSHALAEALVTNGLPAPTILHNGIDPTPYDQISGAQIADFRQEFNLKGRKAILFGGRVTYWKGREPLLAALNDLVPKIPDLCLLILSKSTVPADIIAQYPNLRPQHIRQTGWLDGEKLLTAYRTADVVTVPSVYLDPFPTVNLEAMAAGKPVVATIFGGSPEAVDDGITGFCVNPLDTAQFADTLGKLLTDDNLRQEMGQAGRQRLENHFTQQHYLQKLRAIYADVLKNWPS